MLKTAYVINETGEVIFNKNLAEFKAQESGYTFTTTTIEFDVDPESREYSKLLQENIEKSTYRSASVAIWN